MTHAFSFNYPVEQFSQRDIQEMTAKFHMLIVYVIGR